MSDARKQVTLDDGMTGLPEFVGVHCESVEILPDFAYVTVSDYLSHLGTYSSKAEGRIQDVSVTSHQDERHLNEHIDIQQTQGSSLQKDHPKLFRSRKVDVSRSHAPCVNGIFSPGRRGLCGCVPRLSVEKKIEVRKRGGGQAGAYTETRKLILLR